MTERDYALVGASTEQVEYRHIGRDQDESDLCHVQGEQLGAKGGGTVRPMDEEILFISVLRVWYPWNLDFLGEEDVFDVLLLVEDIHPGEDGRVLEGRQTLFEGSVDVPMCRRVGSD